VLSLEEVRVGRRIEEIKRSRAARKEMNRDINANLQEIQEMLIEDWSPENLSRTLNPVNIAERWQLAFSGQSKGEEKAEFTKLDPRSLSEEERGLLKEQKGVSERFESLKRKSRRSPPQTNEGLATSESPKAAAPASKAKKPKSEGRQLAVAEGGLISMEGGRKKKGKTAELKVDPELLQTLKKRYQTLQAIIMTKALPPRDQRVEVVKHFEALKTQGFGGGVKDQVSNLNGGLSSKGDDAEVKAGGLGCFGPKVSMPSALDRGVPPAEALPEMGPAAKLKFVRHLRFEADKAEQAIMRMTKPPAKGAEAAKFESERKKADEIEQALSALAGPDEPAAGGEEPDTSSKEGSVEERSLEAEPEAPSVEVE